MEFFGILMLLAILILAVLIFSVLLLYLYSLVVTRVPFIFVPPEIIPDILRVLNLRPHATLYDLGCGDGRVLVAAAREQCDIKGVGMDKSPLAIWLARRAARRAGVIDHLQLFVGNFFCADFSNATHVFCYLYPAVLRDMEPIFERQMPAGSRLVSVDYALPNKAPASVIELHRKGSLGERLYLYTY